ncbi:hypothetical protein MtrunA17_Chr2g0295501 [Medicago truncatula]|uniref:Uncharacterized protein n=1 Tax=Medicago truncatula TaxID=3880 RepID=A0A396J4Y2_MEDTR|nr:hypothetical protein MtrunA17_Chr2g0295501 [Medicago truncatula]
MAPPSSDLRKIGLEGFALIDKFYGPTRRISMQDRASGVSKDGTVYFVDISNLPQGKITPKSLG